jgi:hypothetical protein
VQLTFVQFEPVQQVAAEPATLKALVSLLRAATGPALKASQMDFLTGFPLINDPAVPKGFIYLRPNTPPAGILTAPWTPEQVDTLNLAQRSGGMHPLACGAHHPRDLPTLIATPDGWTCPDEDCTFAQDWAYTFMLRPTTSTGEPLHPKDQT